MVNKKLMALALLCFGFSVLSYWYIDEHPKVVAISAEQFTGASELVDQSILYAIDSISSDGNTLKCNGWAFEENQSSESSCVAFALRDGSGHSYVFPAIMSERKDVAAAYESEFYLQSGFSASCKMSGLSKDIYMVILYLNNDARGEYSTIQLPYQISFNGDDKIEIIEGEMAD